MLDLEAKQRAQRFAITDTVYWTPRSLAAVPDRPDSVAVLRSQAVRRREPTIDFVSAQQAGLDGVGDPELLDRTAAEGRVLVSHDRRTMIGHFRAHLAVGKSAPGLLIVSEGALVVAPGTRSLVHTIRHFGPNA